MADFIQAMFKIDNLMPVLSCPRCSFIPPLDSEIDARSFAHHFQSWFSPRPEDENEIRGHLTAVEAEKRRLMDERSRLQAALDRVDGELTRLECIAIGLKGAVSRLRHLPTEVLQFIFGLVPPWGTSATQTNSQSAWKISHVCTRWRQIVISTPALWAHIIPPTCSGDRNQFTPGTESILELVIERSKEFPLDFSLGENWGRISGHDTDACSACQLLVKLSPRIRHLNYWLHHGDHWENGPFPTFSQLYSVQGSLDRSSILCHAPLLKTADIRFRAYFSMLQFPWKQLTHLNMDVEGGLEKGVGLLQVLRDCMDLVFFGLKTGTQKHRRLGEDELKAILPVSLPRLRVLHAIDGQDSSHSTVLQDIMSRLRCPSLESMTISGINDTFYQLILDSNCQTTLVELFVRLAPGKLSQNTQDLLFQMVGEMTNIEVLTLYPHKDLSGRYDPLTPVENYISQLCSLLRPHTSNQDIGGIRVVRAGCLLKPPSYLKTTGQLRRNSFAYLLHQGWDDWPDYQVTVSQTDLEVGPGSGNPRLIGCNSPQRQAPNIVFHEFGEDRVVPTHIVDCGIKYLCVV